MTLRLFLGAAVKRGRTVRSVVWAATRGTLRDFVRIPGAGRAFDSAADEPAKRIALGLPMRLPGADRVLGRLVRRGAPGTDEHLRAIAMTIHGPPPSLTTWRSEAPLHARAR